MRQNYLRHKISLQQQVFQVNPEPTTVYALVSLFPEALSGRMPLDIRLVLDRSYSMTEKIQGEQSKLDLLKQGAVLLIDQLRPGDRLTVVTFHDKHQVLIPPTTLTDEAQRRRLQEEIRQIQPGGGTRMSTALKAASKEPPCPDFLTRLIFFTDGQICCGNQRSEREKCLQLALEQRRELPWLVLATGTDYDDQFLGNLAELNAGRYDHVSELSFITELFENEIAVMGEVALTQAMLSVETLNGFELRQVNRVIPEMQAVSFQDLHYCAVSLGEIDRVRGQKVLLQLEGPLTQVGQWPLARLKVAYHLPLKKLLNLQSEFELMARVEQNPGPLHGNAEVLHTIQLTGASQLTRQGLSALQQGLSTEASRTLSSAAELYTRLGDAEMGQQLRTLCTQTPSTSQQEETRRTLTTQLKYSVQRTRHEPAPPTESKGEAV